jgi:hypothetical protein
VRIEDHRSVESCKHPGVLDASALQIEAELPDHATVLDVGGWNKPFRRADWVLDLMPFETRGLQPEGVEERFDASRWTQLDICARDPWPFDDDQFDFVVCSHTLEDVRDPVWVCGEMSRVAKAGYVEVPSRLEEQTWGVNGAWAGWSHHHWLVDVTDASASFTLKPHFLHARPDLQISIETLQALDPLLRVSSVFWTDAFAATELIHYTAEGLEEYLRAPIRAARLTPRSEDRVGMRRRIAAAVKGSR